MVIYTKTLIIIYRSVHIRIKINNIARSTVFFFKAVAANHEINYYFDGFTMLVSMILLLKLNIHIWCQYVKYVHVIT